MSIAIKRVYDPAGPADGHRALVDRMWPRGVSKEKAAVDGWYRELAPSRDLRRWFGHDPARWRDFRRRYFEELDAADPESVETLRRHARESGLTLVYAARDREHNNAVALRDYLEGHR